MSKKQKKSSLPKHAPKRTGKRGIGPVDDDAKPAKQKRLPGMEDPAIEELEDAAKEYAGLRDHRMRLTEQESAMKESLLGLMKKHSKETYRHDGVEIRIVHEEETVKVKLIEED